MTGDLWILMPFLWRTGTLSWWFYSLCNLSFEQHFCRLTKVFAHVTWNCAELVSSSFYCRESETSIYSCNMSSIFSKSFCAYMTYFFANIFSWVKINWKSSWMFNILDMAGCYFAVWSCCYGPVLAECNFAHLIQNNNLIVWVFSQIPKRTDKAA